MARRRRRNPGSYWINFALAASAVVAIMYFAKGTGPRLEGK